MLISQKPEKVYDELNSTDESDGLCQPNDRSAWLHHDWQLTRGKIVCKRCGKVLEPEDRQQDE